MKLSIFTTATNPIARGDTFNQAIDCYYDLADELVVVGSSKTPMMIKPDIKIIHSKWPHEFSWEYIGQQFQRGYEACTGNWVIHADLDFIFHENDFEAIGRVLQDNSDQPAVSFLKRQFILPDRFNLKSRLIVAVNKGAFGDRIRFDSGGDLCQPSLDGKYIEPGTVPDLSIPIWNYEKILKTEAQIKDDVERMARAWHRHFGEFKLGDTKSAYSEWLKMVTGRFSKPSQRVKLEDHPMYMHETIKSLKPHNFGYNGFGLIEGGVYA